MKIKRFIKSKTNQTFNKSLKNYTTTTTKIVNNDV